ADPAGAEGRIDAPIDVVPDHLSAAGRDNPPVLLDGHRSQADRPWTARKVAEEHSGVAEGEIYAAVGVQPGQGDIRFDEVAAAEAGDHDLAISLQRHALARYMGRVDRLYAISIEGIVQGSIRVQSNHRKMVSWGIVEEHRSGHHDLPVWLQNHVLRIFVNTAEVNCFNTVAVKRCVQTAVRV